MKKPNFTVIAVLTAFILFCANSVSAQNQGSPSQKKALIQEIQELTSMKSLIPETKMSNLNIGDLLLQLVEKDKELAEAQKQELRKPAQEAKERLEKQVIAYSEDSTVIIPMFEEVFFKLYDKTFTEDELREMVVFYRTPTGQKAAKFMRDLVSQLHKDFIAVFTQKFKEFTNSKLQEEWNQLKQKIMEMKKPKLET